MEALQYPMNMRRAEIWLCHVAALKNIPARNPKQCGKSGKIMYDNVVDDDDDGDDDEKDDDEDEDD